MSYRMQRQEFRWRQTLSASIAETRRQCTPRAPIRCISRLPPMRTPTLAWPPCGSRASIQSDRHRALARVYKTALCFGEASSHVFPHFPSPVCVHKVSQVGAEQARIDLQVVILEWLVTAAILAVHLAQVSQVDRVPQVRVVNCSRAVR